MRFALLFALAACGTSISSIPVNAPPHALQAKTPQAVAVFTSAAPLRPHVDVALLEVTATDDYAGEVLAALRARAAGMGCDAIVIGGQYATCIAYTDLPPNIAAADYDACHARWLDERTKAMHTADLNTRGQMLAGLPRCGPTDR